MSALNVDPIQNGSEILLKAVGGLKDMLDTSVKAQEGRINAMHIELGESKKATDEQRAIVAKLAADAVKGMEEAQSLRGTIDAMKRQLDSPVFSGSDKDANDAVKEVTIGHYRSLFELKNGDSIGFKESSVDFAAVDHLKMAQRKLIVASNENSYRHILSTLTDDEKKAMTMSQLDGYQFMPEISTIVRECFLEPIGLQDLYDMFPVSRQSFMYPFIGRHDRLGGFVCGEDCGTIQAATNNITYRNAKVYDWRGTFCTTTATLEDSSINILTWMANEMALSYRMTGNESWIAGDGVQKPQGWLNSNCFPVMSTVAAGKLSAADLRAFMNSVPYEYGSIVGVMHPDTLALFASMVDTTNRFLLGDDQLFLFATEITDGRIRLSRYLPKLVSAGSGNWVAGGFVAAAANWKKAYIVPVRRNMLMQQAFGLVGPTPWCASYNFWAQLGGATSCCDAGRVLRIQ